MYKKCLNFYILLHILFNIHIQLVLENDQLFIFLFVLSEMSVICYVF